MKRLAIIPARGGSKRIPRKNVKEFCGRPIIAYSIEAALKSGIFDEVMVSTEDAEIVEIARQYGASVPFMRSAEASSDYATDDDVMDEVLEKYEEMGKTFDTFALIYACAPFITPEQLREAFELLEKNDVDSVIPLTRYSYPPQRSFVIRDGNVQYRYPEYRGVRSQELEPYYHDIGQYYVYKTDVYRKLSPGNGKRSTVITPEELCQDIDNESDWELAELKYKNFVLKNA